MFGARTGTAHELTRHACEYWNQRLGHWGNHSLAQPVGGQQSLPKDVLCSIQYNSGLLGTQRPVTLLVKSLTGNKRLHNHLRRPIWGRGWRCWEPSYWPPAWRPPPFYQVGHHGLGTMHEWLGLGAERATVMLNGKRSRKTSPTVKLPSDAVKTFLNLVSRTAGAWLRPRMGTKSSNPSTTSPTRLDSPPPDEHTPTSQTR